MASNDFILSCQLFYSCSLLAFPCEGRKNYVCVLHLAFVLFILLFRRIQEHRFHLKVIDAAAEADAP